MRRQIKALIVVPENNRTMQSEIVALCPALEPIPVARVRRPSRTLQLEDLPAYAEATLAAVEPFADQQFDLVIYGCTAAGFLGGPVGNARMVERLRERLQTMVVSTAGAMVDVLRSEDVSSAAVVTPYLQPVSFFCATTAELGRITETQVLGLAQRTVTPRSEALFIACSQLPTLDAVAKLRASLDIPVWSSVVATAWAGTKALAEQGLPVEMAAVA
jgi:maleate cis-trans isomerase